jgi:DNA mismatch repair ATPase MutS
MKAHLLYRNRDINWKWVLEATREREAARGGWRQNRTKEFDWLSGLPWNTAALTADLALDTLFTAMAQGDDCVFEASRKAILDGVKNDIETIRYRQDILRDGLAQPAIVRALYRLASDAMAMRKGHYLGALTQYPEYVLRDAMERMEVFLEFLKKLREIADLHADKFSAEGWTAFFAMIKRDLGDEYFILVQHHLKELAFRKGELLGARLSTGNKAGHYVLHRVPDRKGAWWRRWKELFQDKRSALGFQLHPRDEAGFRALQELQNRGISLATKALGQSADHVHDFFGMLRVELAFYVGGITLHEQLTRQGGSLCFPLPAPTEERRRSFRGLYDICLALHLDRRVVGNDVDADRRDLVIVTGANQGGKSTFLRSAGLAQLMMQCGMFVPADWFCANLCDGLFTHYKREEDTAMKSGKLDEELSRMSDIIDHITPNSMILFNESFAATNEREGSEIARQILAALLKNRVSIICVTHLYELAHGLFESNVDNALFLRAERQDDGARTFKLTEGEPLQTSFGEDLYASIFGID